jgi:membrane-associated phospholipid phosphatase
MGVTPGPAGADEAVDRLGAAYGRQVGRDLAAVVVSPKDWRGRDILTFLAVAGLGAAVMTQDEDIRDWVLGNRTEASLDASSFIRPFGDGGVLAALTLGLYAAGEVAGAPGLRRTSLLGMQSFLTASAFTTVLKTVAGRSRPRAGAGAADFHPFSFTSSRTSLPSGDSAAVWSVATVFADQTDSAVVDVLCYGLATLVAAWRVHDDKHWASDAFLGSAIGYFTAKKICRLHDRRDGPSFAAGLAWQHGRPVVSLSLAF